MRSVLQAIGVTVVVVVAALLVMGQLVKLDQVIENIVDRPASTAER